MNKLLTVNCCSIIIQLRISNKNDDTWLLEPIKAGAKNKVIICRTCIKRREWHWFIYLCLNSCCSRWFDTHITREVMSLLASFANLLALILALLAGISVINWRVKLLEVSWSSWKQVMQMLTVSSWWRHLTPAVIVFLRFFLFLIAVFIT